jgi:hypothetical protein
LVQNRGGCEDQNGEIPQYFKDLNRAPSKAFGPKDFFEIASNNFSHPVGTHFADKYLESITIPWAFQQNLELKMIKILYLALLFSALILSLGALWLAVKELLSD